MKLTLQKTRLSPRITTIRVFVLFLITLFSINFSIGQTTIVDSSQAVKEPSLENLSKNLTTSAEELERIHREEMLEYVYMVVGFAAVFALAWYLTYKAKKRQEKVDEAKAYRIQQSMKNRPHPRR